MMRQEVNLFLLELRPQKIWLSFNHSLVLMMALLLFLLLISCQSYIEKENLMIVNQELVNSLSVEDKDFKVNNLLDKMIEKKVMIEAQINDVAVVIERKKLIRSAYHENAISNDVSFYRIFKALSESADQDISISEIGLYEGGSKIIIGGVARYKEKIPEYLQNLKRNEAISRSVFGLLQINKQENGGFYRFNMRGVDVE